MAISPFEVSLITPVVSAGIKYPGLEQLGSAAVAETAMDLGEGSIGFEALAALEPGAKFFDGLHRWATAVHGFYGFPVPDTLRNDLEERTWPILRAGGLAVIAAAATGQHFEDGTLRRLQPDDPMYIRTRVDLGQDSDCDTQTFDLLRATNHVLGHYSSDPSRFAYLLWRAGIKDVSTLPEVPELFQPSELDSVKDNVLIAAADLLRKGYAREGVGAPLERLSAVVTTLTLPNLAEDLTGPGAAR